MHGACAQKCASCPLAGAGAGFPLIPRYRRAVETYSRLITYPRGALIVVQGEPIDGWHILRQGQARVYLTDTEGREHTVRFAGPGDLIGGCAGDALGDEHGACYSAQALADGTEVCHFPAGSMGRLFADCPELARVFLGLMARHLSDSYRRLHALSTTTVRERLVDALVRLGDAHAPAPGGRITIHLARQQLADMLGVTKETAVRALTSFKEAGLLETRGQAITILDLDALRRQSGPARDPADRCHRRGPNPGRPAH